MTVNELRDVFAKAGVKERAYDFDSGSKDEVYCLDKTPSGWVVYYRERGIRRDEKTFASEDEACHYLHGLVVRDPTTRL